jgi:hypothetical protein
VPGEPPAGVLIVGASPRLVADAAYGDFFDMAASRIAAAWPKPRRGPTSASDWTV